MERPALLSPTASDKDGKSGANTKVDLASTEYTNTASSAEENSRPAFVGCEYEVFLSFCGKDTRTKFTDFLYQTLVKAGIRTFRDDEELPKGKKIEELLDAIERSRILIPIFSKNYASREWCLREIAKIMDCYKLHGRMVLPVFYDVEPSVVREQSGVYESAFSKLERKFGEETIKWRRALIEVATLSGCEVQKVYNGHEGKLIEAIVSHVSRELGRAKLFVPEDIQIQHNYMEELRDLLDLNVDDVRIVGIHGKPNSGKTILAKYVYNEIQDQFGRSCSFLSNIKEKVQKHGLEFLQKQLIDELLEGRGPQTIYSTDEGIRFISQRLCNKKVLILLDDVDKKEQLDALAKENRWFGLGSRIIITTQNKDILDIHGVSSSLKINGSFTNTQIQPTQLLQKSILGSGIQEVTENVLASILQNEVKAIGIYGLGGVGKTTVASNIRDHLCRDQCYFDEVYWIAVSQSCTIYNLQDKIAHESGVKLSDKHDLIVRASLLSEKLGKKGKVLLLLDDVWDIISLEDVGIWKGCKVILTTRFSNICMSMACDKCFKVYPLLPDEAWDLFMKTLGRADLSHDIIDIAREVTKECAGLPLAIITLGSSMRAMNYVAEWRYTLRKLKEAREIEEMNPKLYSVLKLSYDHLRVREVQQCFLYCAAYPEDYAIKRKDLIHLFIHTGLINEDNTEAEFDSGHTILNKLENASLLERVTGNVNINSMDFWRVKMHDLIRDMALRIQQSEFMVKAGMSLVAIPDKEKWETGREGKNLKLVSLMKNNIKEISTSPRSSMLSALLLHLNPLESISDSFFVHFSALKVLNLSRTNIIKLPKSVGKLLELVELDLGYCDRLKVIPSLRRLTNLRKLDLTCTKIKQVPHELEMLTKLRHLNICCTGLQKQPDVIIPKLRDLYHLEVNIASTKYACMEKLEWFVGQFKTWNDFYMFVRSSTMPNDYCILVGCDVSLLLRQIKYFTGGNDVYLCQLHVSAREFSVIPKDVQRLMMDYTWNIRSLWESFHHHSESLHNLKYLRLFKCDDLVELIAVQNSDLGTIQNSQSTALLPNLSELQELEMISCSQLEKIIVTIKDNQEGDDDDEEVNKTKHIILPKLKILLLGKLPSLMRINDGILVCSSLKEVYISDCPKLKRIPFMVLSSLQNLEVLKIWDCEQVEEIIAAGDDNDEEVQGSENADNGSESLKGIMCLPKLQEMCLLKLPNLSSITPKQLVCNSLKKLNIRDCPKLKRIPLSLEYVDGEPSPPSSLKYIELGSLYDENIFEKAKRWWNSLEWDDPSAEILFRPFTFIDGEASVGRKLSEEIGDARFMVIESPTTDIRECMSSH